jgi:hypothetical protein
MTLKNALLGTVAGVLLSVASFAQKNAQKTTALLDTFTAKSKGWVVQFAKDMHGAKPGEKIKFVQYAAPGQKDTDSVKAFLQELHKLDKKTNEYEKAGEVLTLTHDSNTQDSAGNWKTTSHHSSLTLGGISSDAPWVQVVDTVYRYVNGKPVTPPADTSARNRNIRNNIKTPDNKRDRKSYREVVADNFRATEILVVDHMEVAEFTGIDPVLTVLDIFKEKDQFSAGVKLREAKNKIKPPKKTP